MTAPAASPLLAIRGVRAAYGKIEALKGVDLDINPGEIVALIGANGAGKSTLMMTIFGRPKAKAGKILFDGRDITGVATHEIARLRIAQSPEGRRIFPRMSVAENLQMGADATASSEAEQTTSLERVLTLFPRLKERLTQRGGTLSGGEQQMLAIARALMSRPRLLLLDEPSLGLAPLIVRQIFDAIRALNRQDGLTVLIVEQNANHALKLAHRGYVMVNGLITLRGTGAELLQRPEIRAAYLEGGRHWRVEHWHREEVRDVARQFTPVETPVGSVYVQEKFGGTVYVREKLASVSRPSQPLAAGIPATVVIVGGGAAGNAAAEMLRREGYSGRITMLSADESVPCDRPNLSKGYLSGAASDESNPLRSPEFYKDHEIDLHLGARVTTIDTAGRQVRLADGSRHAYDALLLATGAEPVRLDVPGADSPARALSSHAG